MMNLRNTLATSAAAVALLASSSAQAGDYYFSVFGGYSTFDDEIPFQTSQFSQSLLLPYRLLQTDRVLQAGPYYFKAIPTSTGYLISRTIGKSSVTADMYGSTNIVHDSFFNWEDDFDNGFVVGAALGSALADGWRTELEVAYRQAEVSGGANGARRINGSIIQDLEFRNAYFHLDRYAVPYKAYPYFALYTAPTQSALPISKSSASVFLIVNAYSKALGSLTGPTVTFPNASTVGINVNSGGEAQVWSLMANIWYDFDFMGLNPEGVVTFAGAGIGVASLDLEYNASMGTYFGGTIGYGLDDSGMGFAYQLGAGIGFDMGNGMMLSAQYRWFGTSDIDVGATDLRVESHNALIGLSLPFGN